MTQIIILHGEPAFLKQSPLGWYRVMYRACGKCEVDVAHLSHRQEVGGRGGEVGEDDHLGRGWYLQYQQYRLSLVKATPKVLVSFHE